MVRAVETTLQELFEGSKQYQVPLYQRPYSWQVDQLQRLWDDIAGLAEERRGGGRDTHFIGSLVLAPGAHLGPTGVQEFLVVDGQQRLTSLSLLLCAIRDHRAETEDRLHRERINEQYLINKWKPQTGRLKLQPTQADLASYAAVVDNLHSADGSDGIGVAYRFFRSRLSQADDPEDEEDIQSIEEAVIGGLSLVSVTAQHGDNVHRIFESLNNTGMRLTQGDLLRNYIFMRLPTLGPELYRRVWLPMQESLSSQNLELLFWLDLVAGDPKIRQSEIYSSQQQRLERLDGEDAVAAEVSRFARLARLWAVIIDPSGEPDPVVRKRLERLQQWGTTTVYPVLLHLMDRRDTGTATSEQIAAAMLTLESFFVRRLVIGQATKNINRILLGIVPDIADKPDPDLAVLAYLSTGRKYFATDAQIRSAAVSVPFYLNGRAAQRKRILEWLEESLEPGEPIDTSRATIEHVLPQTPSSGWRSAVRADLQEGEDLDQVYESVLHLIGNLTLTTHNASMGNGPFSSKRRRLLKSRVLLNHDITGETSWGRPQILRRSERLAARITALWPPPADVDDTPTAGVDWSIINRAVAAMPSGTWTTYGDLAALIGSHPVPVGTRLANHPVHNAHRVLTVEGRISPGFRWLDPQEARDPRDILAEEGIEFDDDGRASLSQRVTVEELADLINIDPDQVGGLDIGQGDRPDLRDSFLQQISEQPESFAHGTLVLLAAWQALGGTIAYGTSASTTAFLTAANPQDPAGGDIWPFAVYPRGGVEVVFQHLARRAPFDAIELRDQFRRRLNTVPGIELPAGKLAMRPSFPLAVLADEASRDQVIEHLSWFLEQTRAGIRTPPGHG